MTYDEPESGQPPGPGEPASESEPASEASGDDEAQAVSPVLDDPRSIEQGKDEVPERKSLGYLLTIGQIQELQASGVSVEVDPDGYAYEALPELPRDHAAGRPQRGVQRLEDKREPEYPVDRAEGRSQRGVPRLEEEDKPKPRPPADHAGAIPQAGTPANPDPVTIHGFRMSTIAAVAFGAVQSYKARILKQKVRVWDLLTEEDRIQITEAVRPLLSGGDFSPTAMHDTWAHNMEAAGVTVEQDPRIGMPWGDLDPGERRKGYIFAQVCIALTRNV